VRYWNLDGISIWYLSTGAGPGTTYSASVTVRFSINCNSWFWPGGSLGHISSSGMHMWSICAPSSGHSTLKTSRKYSAI
jgi:hypothetical protein